VKGNIEVTVTDSGIGIKPSFLPHVFERFRQADASTTRMHGGLGLGLAIVRHLVESHGGTVRAHSDGLNTGATFVFTVPVKSRISSEPSEQTRSTTVAIVPISLAHIRVLVVDDDRDSREVMTEALLMYGGSVQAASTADDAIDAIKKFEPDVVLTDIAMPGSDGYAVLKRIRTLEAATGRRMPVGRVTAHVRRQW